MSGSRPLVRRAGAAGACATYALTTTVRICSSFLHGTLPRPHSRPVNQPRIRGAHLVWAATIICLALVPAGAAAAATAPSVPAAGATAVSVAASGATSIGAASTGTASTGAASTSATSTRTAATVAAAAGDDCGMSSELVPDCGIWWGAHASIGWSAFEAVIGRKLAIVHDYVDWTDTFPSPSEKVAAAGDRILFVDWTARSYATGNPTATWTQIASGSQDAIIDAEAANLKSFGQKIMLTFQAEPESSVNTSFGTAADYVAAWQHIAARLRADGVTNVVWVWDVTGDVGEHASTYQTWYPGDADVNWIMWDPYNWYGCKPRSDPWQSFASIVSPMYAWLTTHSGTAGNGDYLSKPWGLAEYGTVEDSSPTAKEQWFDSVDSEAQAEFPNLKALVYFDSDDTTNGRSCNWEANTSADSLIGFKDAGAQSYTVATPNQEQAPTITGEPMSVTAPLGEDVTFTAQATGTPTPTVVWQSSPSSDENWTAVSGQTSPSYSLTATATDNGLLYRAVFTNRTNRVNSVSTTAATLRLAGSKTPQGFWLAGADGSVFAAGSAPALAGHHVPVSDPVVGIASTPDGKGYWLVTANGSVLTSGDARGHGSLPADGVDVSDIVAIASTGDGSGYWLIGRDGGEFAFGDAHFHGSLPGLGIHVTDVVGMVATSSGGGYWIVGEDGGVFAFGGTHYVGSLPGDGIHVSDVVAMIPSPTRDGYVLVGKDGGAFVLGNGVHYYGSLPGLHIHITDIVGLALTPDTLGYWFAGADGGTYSFGDGKNIRVPASVRYGLPVVAIAPS